MNKNTEKYNIVWLNAIEVVEKGNYYLQQGLEGQTEEHHLKQNSKSFYEDALVLIIMNHKWGM